MTLTHDDVKALEDARIAANNVLPASAPIAELAALVTAGTITQDEADRMAGVVTLARHDAAQAETLGSYFATIPAEKLGELADAGYICLEELDPNVRSALSEARAARLASETATTNLEKLGPNVAIAPLLAGIDDAEAALHELGIIPADVTLEDFLALEGTEVDADGAPLPPVITIEDGYVYVIGVTTADLEATLVKTRPATA
jgi:hypothetical protein